MNQKTGCVRGCLPAIGGFVRAVFVALYSLLKAFVALIRWWIDRVRQARTPLEAGLWLVGGLTVLIGIGIWAERTETGIAERSARWTATAAAAADVDDADRRATALASDPSPTTRLSGMVTPGPAAAVQTAFAGTRTAVADAGNAAAVEPTAAAASDPSPTPAVPTDAAAAVPAAPTDAAAVVPDAPTETSVPAALPAAPTESAALPPAPAADYPQPSDRLLAGRIVKVVDGDTVDIVIDGVESRVRLIGVDTPESVDPREPVQCFGREASAYTRRLLDGQPVLLEVDPSQGEFDRYDRRLGYIWTTDGRLVNHDLIRDGYAFEYTYNLPYRYQTEFKTAQRTARETAAGLWAPETCAGDVYRGVADAPTAAPSGGGSSGSGASSSGCPALSTFDPASVAASPLVLAVDKRNETVDLTNTGTAPIDVDGWQICSLVGAQLHARLSGTIAAGATLSVPSSAGGAIWNNSSPDPAVVLDAGGGPVAYWPD